MANTTNIRWPFITITPDGSTDWTLAATGDTAGSTTLLSSYSTSGLKVHSIRVHPSAANDVIMLHEEGLDGADIFYAKFSGDTSDKVQYYGGQWLHPAFDASDCTLSSASAVRITIHVL
jgi:hypothetical protein